MLSASRCVHGDDRFLHGNLGEVMASSTESGLGCCATARGEPSIHLPPLPSPAGAGETSDAAADRSSAARTAAMIRRSVWRSSSHFSSAPSSLRRFSAAISGGGGGGGRVGSGRGRGVVAGEAGADSSRPIRRATIAGGGGLGLSQLARRYSGAIVGLRGASHERRRRTAVGVCGFSGACVGDSDAPGFFTGGGDGDAPGFFMGGGDGGGREASSVAFLAVRRFRWRWYGESRRRRPAMHPMLRRGAVAAVDEARRWADSVGCIAS